MSTCTHPSQTTVDGNGRRQCDTCGATTYWGSTPDSRRGGRR